MILLIDNYDSFVYNLARYVSQLGFPYLVKRNDDITLNDIIALNPTHIILSPGPCAPDQAGITLDVIRFFAKKIPMLGICLGHQAIGQAFGGAIVKALKPTHGKAAMIYHDTQGIFRNIPMPFKAARYHSLVISPHNFPDELRITAHTQEGDIMGIQHKQYKIVGVQFHPESILTENGYQLLLNFLTE